MSPPMSPAKKNAKDPDKPKVLCTMYIQSLWGSRDALCCKQYFRSHSCCLDRSQPLPSICVNAVTCIAVYFWMCSMFSWIWGIWATQSFTGHDWTVFSVGLGCPFFFVFHQSHCKVDSSRGWVAANSFFLFSCMWVNYFPLPWTYISTDNYWLLCNCPNCQIPCFCHKSLYFDHSVPTFYVWPFSVRWTDLCFLQRSFVSSWSSSIQGRITGELHTDADHDFQTVIVKHKVQL